MIKKLQRKLTVILAVILFVILFMSLFLIDVYTYHSYEKQYQIDRINAEKKVKRLFRENVKASKEDKVIEQVRAYKNVYAVIVDDEGKLLYNIYSKKKEETVQQAVDHIWNTDQIQGWLAHIQREHLDKEKASGEDDTHIRKHSDTVRGRAGSIYFRGSAMTEGTLIAFYNVNTIIEDMEDLIIYSGVALIVGLVALILLSRMLALILTRPVEESYYRQKRFIADASHELKTPLAVIGVNMEMLIKNPSNTKYMYYIQQESRKMNRLIEELLAMASIDEEEGHVHKDMLDISDAVEAAVEPFEAVAYEKGVTLQTQIDRGICYRANADKLQRLVGILVDNAIKHADFEKLVMVELRLEKNYIVLLVSNTGKEISKEDQKRIFDRFYRANKARCRSEGRYGLGLSIAKAIVQQHKGKIQVKSAEGRTCFRVTFFKKNFKVISRKTEYSIVRNK